MQNNRLMIAGGLLVALAFGAYFALEQRDAGSNTTDEQPELPEIDAAAITRLTITRPGSGDDEASTVTLTKDGDGWRVTAPLDAEADESAITTVLDKLGDLEVSGVAATREESHALLEVDDTGVRVQIEQEGADAITLIIGAFRGQNTMVRLAGETAVLQVPGSIKYAFDKELKDWRQRRVLDISPDRVRRVAFSSENGEFVFNRTTSGDWEAELGEDETPIERFGSSKVQSIVASVARMRAVNFASADVDLSAAGFDAPSGTVTLSIAPPVEESDDDEDPEDSEDAEESDDTDTEDAVQVANVPLEQVVLRVGGESTANSEWYVMHEGNPVIYVISQYLADRMRPDTEKFQNAEPSAAPDAGMPGMPGGIPGMPGGMPGMPGAMPGMPGGPGANPSQMIPPELMQQIQEQLRQQGLDMAG